LFVRIFVSMNVPVLMPGTVLKRAILSSLVAVLSLWLPRLATAQTCTALYDFTATPDFIPRTNSDGSIPQGGLLLLGNTLYGTASGGGASGNGTLFKVKIDGSGFANLYNFTDSSSGMNSDGYTPMSGLILSANTLYGSANAGGTSGNGTLFKINTDGSAFATLHNFTDADGRYLAAGLVLSGNTLYGAAFSGGSAGNGTLFKLNTDGSGFIVLHNFSVADMFGFNGDGTGPQGSLIVSGDTLYGTASGGGNARSGTIFSIKTNGTAFTTLYNFSALSSNPWTNSDGACPGNGLLLSGDTLYGTACQGGAFGHGTLFKLKTNGAVFTTLHHFVGSPNDGASPNATLLLFGAALYGTANSGGSSGTGTAFKLNTDGSGFTTLHHFSGIPTYSSPNADGAYPTGQLILSGDTLYGTAANGGKSGNGTVFAISFDSPKLTIAPSGRNVILFWPTNDTAVTLESTTDLASQWAAVSQPPVPINGQNSVTLPASGPKRFFRLRR
jgi:uncharacterized repeat protein (TIGR03803 family)